MNKLTNRYRLLRDYLRKTPFLSGWPAALWIEATNRCNMDCIMCPHGKLDPPLENMPMGLFKEIADQAKGYVGFMDFSFRGESLLNPDVFEMIRYAGSMGMRTSLQTNGSLLDRENCEALIRSGLDLLTISLDAFLPETYGKIRRGGDFPRVVENAKRMIEFNDRMNGRMIIVIQMIGMEENKEEAQDFKAYWKRQKGVFAKIKPLSSRGGLVHNTMLWPQEGHPVRCSRIWKDMRVCANGTVVPCCNDFLSRYPLGDLNAQTIKEVWNGEAFVDLRRRHCSGEFASTPVCKDCEFLQVGLLKQCAAFVLDDFWVRKLLAMMDLRY